MECITGQGWIKEKFQDAQRGRAVCTYECLAAGFVPGFQWMWTGGRLERGWEFKVGEDGRRKAASRDLEGAAAGGMLLGESAKTRLIGEAAPALLRSDRHRRVWSQALAGRGGDDPCCCPAISKRSINPLGSYGNCPSPTTYHVLRPYSPRRRLLGKPPCARKAQVCLERERAPLPCCTGLLCAWRGQMTSVTEREAASANSAPSETPSRHRPWKLDPMLPFS